MNDKKPKVCCMNCKFSYTDINCLTTCHILKDNFIIIENNEIQFCKSYQEWFGAVE